MAGNGRTLRKPILAGPGVRASSRRHPLLRGLPKSVWHKDLAPLVPGYPKSQETFDRLQARCRAQVLKMRAEGRYVGGRGIPHGWGRRREELARCREAALKEAEQIMTVLIKTGVLPEPGTTDEELGNEAIKHAIAMVRCTSDDGTQFAYAGRERLAAMKLVADFCKVRPVVKTETTLNKAEDFLSAIAATLPPR